MAVLYTDSSAEDGGTSTTTSAGHSGSVDSAGSRMWDRLLSAGGTVSKAVTQRLRDVAGGEEHESDDDSEGVDTHTIRALREYYSSKGRPIPHWLGGDPRQLQPQQYPQNPHGASPGGDVHRQMSPRRSGDSGGLERAQTTGEGGGGGRQKVSLRGIYEQAQSRDAAAGGAPRRAYSSARSAMSRFDSEERTDVPAALPASAGATGDRFKDRMRFNRTVSSNAADPGGSYGRQPNVGPGAGVGPGRVSADYDRPETGASQLRRGGGGLPSRPSQRRI